MTTRSALYLALAAAFPASAVTLNPDGLGQALIYPYYTAQSVGKDAFNTYLSVVNHSQQWKALRLRFREGRLGKSVLDMNLYLSPNDVWTGAVVPFSEGTRLVTTDVSCTEPRFAITVAPGEAPFIDFRNDAFATANDGAGTGLDRTREGFVEIIEMGTFTGAAAAAITHNSAGVPANCAAMASITPQVEAPTGFLSGSATLINVATGLDFTTNAEALDQLASRPFFRRATDPYPDFNASEIDAVSVVEARGATWRSLWNNPVDAVSAVLMRVQVSGEYVLDEATASLTDVVMTLPTRHFHANSTAAAAPFSQPAQWRADCTGPIGEHLFFGTFNREEQTASASNCPFVCPPTTPVAAICADSGVFTVRNTSLRQFTGVSTDSTPVLGSVTRGIGDGSGPGTVYTVSGTRFSNGWVRISFLPSTQQGAPLVSRSQSTRIDHSSGVVTTGSHVFNGLPVVGFSARVFRNGTLRCDAGSCLGNYGGTFPFTYLRDISPAS